MEKLSTLTKAAAWNLLGIMAGILLICSCSAQANAQENQKYESVYADTLTVAGQKAALTVLLNPKDNAEGIGAVLVENHLNDKVLKYNNHFCMGAAILSVSDNFRSFFKAEAITGKMPEQGNEILIGTEIAEQYDIQLGDM